MVNQLMCPRKRVLDCSPIKPTLRRWSTSELPKDRPLKRVSFAEPLIEPPKGHHDGTKVSIGRRDSVVEHGNGNTVPSQVLLEGSMSRTTTDNKREKSSFAPLVKALPSKPSIVSPLKRVLDCSPIKSTLRRWSTSELRKDRPVNRVSFAEPLTEPPKGHHAGTKVSIGRRDLVGEHGNGNTVPSQVLLEGSMSRTTADNNREKSSFAPLVKALPSKPPIASPRERVLDCSPIKPTLRRWSTSELPKDRPLKRVSFAEPLIEPPKGHHAGTKVSISRRDLVGEHGNGKTVPSQVLLEGSMSRTTTDNNREKSSFAPLVKALASKPLIGFKSQTDYKNASATGAEGNKQDISPGIQRHKNGPVRDIIWRGTVEVVECGTLRMSGEMLAHISKMVSEKAIEFSKKIDSKLKFKLLPRSNFYPKLFEDECPDRDDIALYFYPTKNESSEKKYSRLLKDMDLKDLMMRARVADIDLLVFPSTILTPDSQRLDNCFFMWGVFCPANIDRNLLVGGSFHQSL